MKNLRMSLFPQTAPSMKNLLMTLLASTVPVLAASAAVRTEKGVAYAERPSCVLDVRVPVGETNFPTVVWLHGGGLTGGSRHFIPLSDGKIAQVAVEYRLLGKDAARGEDCIEDAAAAVAWTFAHIAEYGGDPARIYLCGKSAGAYLSMMVGMDGRWLAAHGLSNRDLAGIVAVSGQATKHFNVRKFSGDDDPQYLPKIDGLAPLAHVSKDIPPIVSVCGEPPYEWKCRAEENRLLVSSLVALGHPFARYVECPLCDHGRVDQPAWGYIELFVRGRLP